MSPSLKDNMTSQNMDAGGNNMGALGAMALSKSLKASSLTTLELGYNPMTKMVALRLPKL